MLGNQISTGDISHHFSSFAPREVALAKVPTISSKLFENSIICPIEINQAVSELSDLGFEREDDILLDSFVPPVSPVSKVSLILGFGRQTLFVFSKRIAQPQKVTDLGDVFVWIGDEFFVHDKHMSLVSVFVGHNFEIREQNFVAVYPMGECLFESNPLSWSNESPTGEGGSKRMAKNDDELGSKGAEDGVEKSSHEDGGRRFVEQS